MNINTEHIFITKFNINDELYYAKINCTKNKSDLFTIELLSQNQCWSGNFTRDAAQTFGESLDENEEEYFTNVIAALKKKEPTYIVDFTLDKKNINVSKFIWKRKLSKGFLVHGYVMLRNDLGTVTKDTLIDNLLNKNETLQSSIEVCNKEIDSLNNQLLQYKRKFEDLIDIKNTIETNLYGKFVQVLNSKKKRIKLLEDELNINNIEQSEQSRHPNSNFDDD